MGAQNKMAELADSEMETGKKFARQLLRWNKYFNKRQMPWKGEKDPYKIWLSEIILQQTRVDQGLKYYQNFIERFPNISALASAKPEAVFKLWEGLGYYSRCRNLLETARHIAGKCEGKFPADYQSILQLKGVGPYTASAIASFAYNLPHAVVDGNVYRILARIYNKIVPTDSTEGKKYFAALAQQTLTPKKAAEYNQAIMDFGALICKPSPNCEDCFFHNDCKAYAVGNQKNLPVKLKEIKIKERWFYYFVLKAGNSFCLRQRTENDIWQHLHEFPVIEKSEPVSSEQLANEFESNYSFKLMQPLSATVQSTQRLTHQLIHFSFYIIESPDQTPVKHFRWVKINALTKLAFPKTLQQFISHHLTAT